MGSLNTRCFQAFIILIFCLLIMPTFSCAADLNDLFGKQEINEEERRDTIEKIQTIQEKLKLLQDKLRVLERRKAVKAAAERAEETGSTLPETAVQVNWVPVDVTTFDPGEFGLYTYLLYSGEEENFAAVGLLEDFILTIETLPANDIPAGLANQFIIPVEKPQSLINLGRQPYDFKLNRAYLDRFGISRDLPAGPVLVSTDEVVDPYAAGENPATLVIGFGQQTPQRTAQITGLWHQYEKTSVDTPGPSVADLFWKLIDGMGTVQVSRHKQNITVTLPQ